MPTIFREKGYRFFFVMADLPEPVHIHVMKEKAIAKFRFDPVRLSSNKGFKDHELREISDLVTGHEELIRSRWDERLRSRY
jgi:3-methyladenine DNA glycosylase AlkD